MSQMETTTAAADAVHAFAGQCQIAAGTFIESTESVLLFEAIHATLRACPEGLSAIHMWPVAHALVCLGRRVVATTHTALFSRTDAAPSPRVRTIQVLDHILALHARPSLTLAEIAGRLQVRETYLSDVLNRVSGRGFLEHLHAIRVLHAMARLAEGPDKVATIARASGYCCASQLNRHFRRHVHTTPSRFRRLLTFPRTLTQRSFS